MAVEAPIEHDLDWPVVSLTEIATKIGSGATPKGGADAYLPTRSRFALVRSQNVFDRRFDHAGLAFITDEQAEGLRGVLLKPGDILFNITGDGITFGRACMVPTDVLPACVNQHVSIVRIDPRRADAGYVLAFLTHPSVKPYIESFNAGGSRRAVTKGHIESFRIPLPPLQEQRAIAHILGALDDKIELNRQMSETLEAMARALFKSWFVDFDPIRAKAEGRDPGLPKPLADLFPARLVDSELGEIPEGWDVARFADTIEIVGGGTPKTSVAEYWDGDIPWFSVVDAPTGSEVWVVDTEKKVTRAGLENSSTRVLPVGTTIISARGTVGRIALVGVPMAMNQSCYGLRGRTGGKGFFTYFSTRELAARLQQHAHGSVFDTITRDTLTGVLVVMPPAKLVDEFEKRVGPSLERIRVGLLASQTLAGLRDTLLPQLVSGELPVNRAERFVVESL
jgi:type I restriction enzyme S subunit